MNKLIELELYIQDKEKFQILPENIVHKTEHKDIRNTFYIYIFWSFTNAYDKIYTSPGVECFAHGSPRILPTLFYIFC